MALPRKKPIETKDITDVLNVMDRQTDIVNLAVRTLIELLIAKHICTQEEFNQIFKPYMEKLKKEAPLITNHEKSHKHQ